MAEWGGAFTTTSGTLGDAQASYSQTDDSSFNRVRAACWGYQGVAPGYLNELKPTITGANTASVNTGGAMVDGKVYVNSAAVAVNIPSAVGGGNTRIDRIVIRCTWAGTDVLVTRIAGTDAGSPTAPAITETSGTTYDIKVAQVLVDTAGTCTVTDERDFASPPELAIAVLGNAANTTVATWGAIAAASDHTVLQRHGTSAGFAAIQAGMYAAFSIAGGDITAGAITNTKIAPLGITGDVIAADAITNTKIADVSITAGKLAAGAVTAGAYGADSITITDIGALVPGFLGRQGGSATDWSVPGGSNYTSGINIRVQCGATATAAGGTVTVTFPTAFSNKPVVGGNPLGVLGATFVGVDSVTASQAAFAAANTSGTGVATPILWWAFGPE